jgi:hypothetical protein
MSDYRDDELSLWTKYDPAKGEPGITDEQAANFTETVKKFLTDPAQIAMAMAAIDARRPLRAVNSIVYSWPDIKP